MLVRFKDSVMTQFKGQTVWFHKDSIADIPDELANRFVATGRAVECAALAPPAETTMKPAPQPKGRGRREYRK